MNANVDEADRADALVAAAGRVSEYMDAAREVVTRIDCRFIAATLFEPELLMVAQMIQRETLKLEDRLEARDRRTLKLARLAALKRETEDRDAMRMEPSGHGERG